MVFLNTFGDRQNEQGRLPVGTMLTADPSEIFQSGRFFFDEWSKALNQRIAFLDVEGTLLRRAIHLDNGKVAPSAWTLIAEILGPDALREEEETKDRWNDGKYSGYIEWMRETIRIHQKYGLTVEAFNEALDAVEPMPGAAQTVAQLHTRGYVTAMISGGFKRLVDRLQRSFRIDHALAGCEYFFDDAGQLEHWNLMPADYEGKVEFMHALIREYGTGSEHCIFVGDGPNDVALAKAVGVSICFNGPKMLSEVTTHSVIQSLGEEDLTAILKYVH